MKEVFYEESALNQKQKSEKIKYNTCVIFAGILFAFAIIWFAGTILSVRVGKELLWDLIEATLLPIISVVGGLLLLKFKNSFCIDYDYTFTSGTLSFAKVINNKKRKLMFKFESSDIEKVGRVGSKDFSTILEQQGVDVYVLTANEDAAAGKELFYILTPIETRKTVIVLECTQQFIANIVKYCGKRIIEEGYK